MTVAHCYALAGAAVFAIGLRAVIQHAHLMRKILALNVTGSGVFLVVGALARPETAQGTPDPVPHALVITGIVIAVAATAFALVLMLRVAAETGRPELPDSDT